MRPLVCEGATGVGPYGARSVYSLRVVLARFRLRWARRESAPTVLGAPFFRGVGRDCGRPLRRSGCACALCVCVCVSRCAASVAGCAGARDTFCFAFVLVFLSVLYEVLIFLFSYLAAYRPSCVSCLALRPRYIIVARSPPVPRAELHARCVCKVPRVAPALYLLYYIVVRGATRAEGGACRRFTGAKIKIKIETSGDISLLSCFFNLI